jgi:hypothetical protein
MRADGSSPIEGMRFSSKSRPAARLSNAPDIHFRTKNIRFARHPALPRETAEGDLTLSLDRLVEQAISK